MPDIRFRGLAFDPVRDATRLAEDPAFQPPPAGRDAPRYVILQTATLDKKQALALRKQDTRVLEYFDGGGWLCALAADPTRRQRPAGGPVLPYAWRLKLDPVFYGAVPGTVTRVTSLPIEGPSDPAKPGHHTPIDVDVLLHRDVGPGDPAAQKLVLTSIRRLAEGGTFPRGDGLRFRTKVAPASLASLAAIEGVRAVTPAKPASVSNDVAVGLLNLAPVHAKGAWRGKGQVVCVNEPGFDDGAIDDVGVHPAFAEVDPKGRRRSRVLEFVSTPLGDGSPRPKADLTGHATHVCGSVAGALDCGPAATGAPPTSLCGTAPEASLVVVNLQSAGGALEVPADLAAIWDRLYRDRDARVYTCSWNHKLDVAPLYGTYAEATDAFTWDRPDAVVLFSAGNKGLKRVPQSSPGVWGPTARTVKDPGTSKNTLCVGAVESVRSEVTTTYQGMSGVPVNLPGPPEVARDADRVAAFSGRGPSFVPALTEPDVGPDPVGRAKPDLVAPGTAIASVESRGLPPNTDGSPGDPVTDCAPMRPSGVHGAFFLQGTSMATPLAAGCAAVVREWLIADRKVVAPPAALVKALLVNGATPLGAAGPGAPLPDDRPDEGSGFGRVNVAAVVEAPATCRFFTLLEGSLRDVDTPVAFVLAGTLDATTAAPRRLKVTLAWTDAPGEALQTDLDLVVLVDKQERHGNCGTLPHFDRANTVEQVDWASPPSGDLHILVKAHRLAFEVLEGTKPAQPFHVVVRVE